MASKYVAGVPFHRGAAEIIPIEPVRIMPTKGALVTTAPPSSSSILIIGAGVIGLGIGWRLASAGCSVHVFDKGEAGFGASHAAAGMLAAGVEVEPGEEGQLPLNRHSQQLWPAFAAELEAASGMEIDLRTEGTLVVALNADDVARLRFNFDLQKSLGLAHEWLTGGEAKKREPYLHTNTVAAIFSPGDHQVDNRKLAKALRIAFERAGGQLHEHTPVAEILTEGNRAIGIRLESGDFHHADTVVLAAGAWSRAIPGLPNIALPSARSRARWRRSAWTRKSRCSATSSGPPASTSSRAAMAGWSSAPRSRNAASIPT